MQNTQDKSFYYNLENSKLRVTSHFKCVQYVGILVLSNVKKIDIKNNKFIFGGKKN